MSNKIEIFFLGVTLIFIWKNRCVHLEQLPNNKVFALEYFEF